MDHAALLAMAHTLHRAGLFGDGRSYSTGDILSALGAAPRHHWIVRRWLAALTREGMLRCEGGEHHGLRPVSRPELAAAMRNLETGRRGMGYPAEMGRFFQTALRSLPNLVRDEISLQSLLFPGGETGTAQGNYRDNLVSRHLNALAAAAVATASRSRDAQGRLRVLEIGAGVGATTEFVLDALAHVPLDYLFTDVSGFFLDAAHERFGHMPGMRYALLDINATMSAQLSSAQLSSAQLSSTQCGDEAPFDIVLAANVLHNARHTGRTLAAIRELLVPGGTLVLLESCIEHHLVSTSMHFLMSPRPEEPLAGFADLREGQDRVFLTRTEWLRQLAAVGFRDVQVRPDPDDPIAAAGQYVFSTVRGEGAHRPDPASLLAAAAERLPRHLVLREIQSVDAFPGLAMSPCRRPGDR
ncbi:class I SAM-dependent methyltransferase [Microbispora sp. CA-102843]|uniref:class I SAM-dependent methyltransferase n=1 Tax=Microbispora sp. CA-102843 TaxID=3239952 RepID=UPI003D932409